MDDLKKRQIAEDVRDLVERIRGGIPQSLDNIPQITVYLELADGLEQGMLDPWEIRHRIGDAWQWLERALSWDINRSYLLNCEAELERIRDSFYR